MDKYGFHRFAFMIRGAVPILALEMQITDFWSLSIQQYHVFRLPIQYA